MDQALELLGDHLVALAHDDVEHSLSANDLGSRGDQRRVTGILTHAGDFGQNFVQLIFLASVLELLKHVGEHAARNLIQQGVGINAQALRIDLAVGDVLFAQFGEVSTHNVQLVQVKAGVIIGALQGGDQAFGRHMGSAQSQRAHGGIHNVSTGFDALQDGHGGQTGGVMAVDVNRDADGLLQLAHQLGAGVGLEQARHILDADRVCAHLFQGLGILGKILVVMHRAQGVADAGLNMCLFLVGCLDGSLQVAGVVQSIENTDHINAVGNALLYKVLNGVVSIGAVAQHVLAAEQHLQFLMRQFFTQDAQTLPRIFVQKADAGVKRCAAPALHREVRDLVHFGQDGTHFIHRHTGGQQRLMRITQNDFGNLNRFLSQSRSPHFLTFGIVYALSAHGVQHIAGVDGIALANVNAGNGAVLRCADLVFHLHGFEDHDNIASLNSSACLDLDVQDGARHGSVDRNRTSGSGCGRCSSRSRCSGGCRSGSRGSSNRSSAVGVFFNGNVVSNAVHGNSQVFHKKDPP